MISAHSSNTCSSRHTPDCELLVLRRFLVLVSELLQIPLPLTTLSGLRRTVDALLELAELSDDNEQWQGRLRALQEDANLMRIMLGLLRFLMTGERAELERISQRMQRDRTHSSPTALNDWMPTAIQLVQLVTLAGCKIAEWTARL